MSDDPEQTYREAELLDNITAGIPFAYCFLLDDFLSGWDADQEGLLLSFDMDDSLYLACCEYMRSNSDQCFADLEQLREYAKSHHWANIEALNRVVDDWKKRLERSAQENKMSESYMALKVVMMPRDANPIPTVHGDTHCTHYLTIFGGVILSFIDQAGAIGARHEIVRAGGALPMLVTVAMNRVEFKQPVLVGDVVRFLTRLVRIGRCSITMHVQVEAERGREVLQVTEAEVVYVGVDPNGPERRPVPLLSGS